MMESEIDIKIILKHIENEIFTTNQNYKFKTPLKMKQNLPWNTFESEISPKLSFFAIMIKFNCKMDSKPDKVDKNNCQEPSHTISN